MRYGPPKTVRNQSRGPVWIFYEYVIAVSPDIFESDFFEKTLDL